VCNNGSTVRPGDRVGVVSQVGGEVPIIDHDSGESDWLSADLVHHAELAWPPGGGVMLGSAGTRAPGTCHAYVACDDPDALYKRALERRSSNGVGFSL